MRGLFKRTARGPRRPTSTDLPLICGRDLEGVALPRLLLLHAADGPRRHHQPRHRLHLRLEPQHARLGRRRRERRHDIHALKEKGEEGVSVEDGWTKLSEAK